MISRSKINISIAFEAANDVNDGDFADVESSCEVKHKKIRPLSMHNIYNEHVAIFNSFNHIQELTTEMCM